jgi:hypothetical protein
MRKTIATAMLALATTACSSNAASPQTVTTTTTQATTTTTENPKPPATTTAKKSAIGVPATVKAANGAVAEVTIVKVVDPATATGGYGPAPAGQHYEAIQLKILNKGPGRFDDSPMYGVRGADSKGEDLNIQAGMPVTSGAALDVLAGVKLGEGDTALGYVTYKVPNGEKITRIQYTPTGGSTGEWALG